MPTGPIPTGLQALLAKLGLTGKMLGAASAEAKGKAKAMQGAEGKEGDKGAALGDDGLLLSGLGYGIADKAGAGKNVSERANLVRFLQALQQDGADPKAQLAKLTQGQAQDKGAAQNARAAGQEGEAQLMRDGGEALVRRDDGGREDARIVGQHTEAPELKETKETRDPSEADQHRQDRDPEDEEDRPGAGWVAEEFEEDEEDDRETLRTPDALDERQRCRGSLEDGSRCLRRALDGTPYCREHAAGPIPPVGSAVP